MNVFHLVIDTSMLRRVHFQHSDFARLLQQSQMGKLKIYIPYIALEEDRTAHVANYEKTAEEVRLAFAKLKRGMLGMIVEGLAEPLLELCDTKEVEHNSKATFRQFVANNKITVIDISMEHAANAWARYFNTDPPFNPNEDRVDRRKDIPDSWILEAGIEIKPRKGLHCSLVGDKKLIGAFEKEGFKVYEDVKSLLDDIEQATDVVLIRPPVAQKPLVPLDQLRSTAFKDMDVILLGLIDALNTPSKEELFSILAKVGFNRDIAEHEARTMVLSERLTDTGTHLIPTNRALAQQAAATEVVTEVLLRIP